MHAAKTAEQANCGALRRAPSRTCRTVVFESLHGVGCRLPPRMLPVGLGRLRAGSLAIDVASIRDADAQGKHARTVHHAKGETMLLRSNQPAYGKTVFIALPLVGALVALAGCGEVDDPDPSGVGRKALAMMDDDGEIHCGNCVGGDCAMLHCFENWTHGGGESGGEGGGGPYQGGGGSGPSMTCHTDVACSFQCTDDVFYPCYDVCISRGAGDTTSLPFRNCVKYCNGARRDCLDSQCRICR